MGDIITQNIKVNNQKRKSIDQKAAQRVLEECKNIIGKKNVGKKGIRGKSITPKSSLDKVAQDIKSILGQLKEPPLAHERTSQPVSLKVEDREFFKAEAAKRQERSKLKAAQKSNDRNQKCNSINKLSKNSNGINKLKSTSSSKHGSLCIVLSNKSLKNVVRSKTELEKFKQKINLTTTSMMKHHNNIVNRVDSIKIARDVGNMIKASLLDSELSHKPPLIDVTSFLTKSLQMASALSFQMPKKITECKMKTSNITNTSPSDRTGISYNAMPKEKKKIENDGNKLPCKELKKIPTPTTTSLQKDVEDNLKAQSHIKSSNQNIKSKIESNSANHMPPKPVNTNQNKTAGSAIVRKQKSPVRRSPQKVLTKPNSRQMNRSNSKTNRENVRPISRQQSKNGMTHTESNLIAKSNGSLLSNSVLNNRSPKAIQKKASNAGTTSKPPISQSFTKSSNVSNVMKRGNSFTEGTKVASPSTRTLTSVSSKYLSGKITSHYSIKVPSSGTLSSRSSRRQNEPLSLLRQEVSRAIRTRKTFTVDGIFPAVRKALLKRGWVEKYHFNTIERITNETHILKYKTLEELASMIHSKDNAEICKRLIKSKLLGGHQVDLYWGRNYEGFQLNSDKVKLTKFNKFKRDVFSYTNKQGLCEAAKNAHWFNFPGLAHINHPRTYALVQNGDTNDFIKDFRQTAAMSLLKWVLKNREANECKIISNSGKIPLEAFEFAANECYKMVIEADNLDIDQPINQATEKEWSQYLEYFYKILHIGNHFKTGALETEDSMIEKSSYLIDKLAPHYPHLKMDGIMNIWILKPITGCQGIGIHICRTLHYIMQTVKSNAATRYIVQKYIERPLLIFNTKFDIRQWFLISSSVPLTIWMYKECYVRFSSQTYNLRKLHESIHLTNNSVQQRYQNTSHDITLPNYNMWDSIQFRNYLSNIGYPDTYRKVVYKGMIECIIGAVLIHQDKIDKRKNCFELYGADFMLTEDFQPWLIEINSSPALHASTPITYKMCPQVVEDTIKVVVDYANNSKANTGNFEMIYKQPKIDCISDRMANNLKVSGKPLPQTYFCPEEGDKPEPITPPPITTCLEIEKKKATKEAVSVDVKDTLENILKFIQLEKTKRKQKLMTTIGTDAPNEDTKNTSTSTSTTSCLSLSGLKSQIEKIATRTDILINQEDEQMVEETLKMLKDKKNNDVLKQLIDMIERIANQTEAE